MKDGTLIKTKIVLEDCGQTLTTYVWIKVFWFFGYWKKGSQKNSAGGFSEGYCEQITPEKVDKILHDKILLNSNIIEDYEKALEALYKHVGDFEEDWVVCPIDVNTDCYWDLNSSIVRFAETEEKFYSNGDYYQDDIYRQRFYTKWVYEGEKYTMVFCDPHTDGMKWFRIFDNSKRLQMREDAHYVD